MIFHLADAPCHGRRFHDGCGDNYEGGDLHGRDICKLLRDLRVGQSIGKYSFSHINSTTKKMIQQFKLCAGPEGSDWIMEDVIGSDTSKLTSHVTRSITGQTTYHTSYVPVLVYSIHFLHMTSCQCPLLGYKGHMISAFRTLILLHAHHHSCLSLSCMRLCMFL